MKPDHPAMRAFMGHRAMLTDYAAKVTGDRAVADDIIQQAWITLAESDDRPQIREPLGYLRTMVRNLAIDHLRHKAREGRLAGADMETATRTVADAGASPEMALAGRRDLACVMGVLQQLPERQRLAVELYCFGGHKLREVALRLGISVSLVHLLVSQGLAACAGRCGLDRGRRR